MSIKADRDILTERIEEMAECNKWIEEEKEIQKGNVPYTLNIIHKIKQRYDKPKTFLKELE